MAQATIDVVRLTGAGPTENVITGLNTMSDATDAQLTTDTVHTIVVPSSSSNNSYWVVTRFKATVTPQGTANNLKWYTAGSNPWQSGVTMVVNTATGYVQATGTDSVSGTVLTVGNYATLAGAPTNAFAFTSGSPLSVNGSVTNPTTGQFGDYIVWQVQVASGTVIVPNPTVTTTLTYQWDET